MTKDEFLLKYKKLIKDTLKDLDDLSITIMGLSSEVYQDESGASFDITYNKRIIKSFFFGKYQDIKDIRRVLRSKETLMEELIERIESNIKEEQEDLVEFKTKLKEVKQ